MVNIMDSNNESDPQKESNPEEVTPKKVTLVDLARKSWLDLPARVKELDRWTAPIIEDLVYAREHQIQLNPHLSRNRSLFPEGGDPFERLDWDAYLRLREKLATRQPIEPADFEVWREDELIAEPTAVQTFILGDGTTSTGFELCRGGGPRINTVIQTMATVRQGAKCAAFDDYCGMFGRNEIDMLASPGDDDETVGKNFERARDYCDAAESNLAPSIMQAVGILAAPDTDEERGQRRYAGMTHFLIIGDGGLDDIEATAKILKTLFRLECGISVDIAVLSTNTNSGMHKLVEAVKKDNPGAAIGIINSVNPDENIPGRLADMVKARFFESLQGVQGVPDAVKRERFRMALQLLDPPKPARPGVKRPGAAFGR